MFTTAHLWSLFAAARSPHPISLIFSPTSFSHDQVCQTVPHVSQIFKFRSGNLLSTHSRWPGAHKDSYSTRAGGFLWEVRRRGRKAGRTLQCRSELKMSAAILRLPHTPTECAQGELYLQELLFKAGHNLHNIPHSHRVFRAKHVHQLYQEFFLGVELGDSTYLIG